MDTFKLEISHESADSLFVDMLNDDLDALFNIENTIFIHDEDYEYNITIAKSIEVLMSYHLNRPDFSVWLTDCYLPKLERYTKYYQGMKKV